MRPALMIEDLSKSFGGLKAAHGFHLELGSGEIHGIIGPNGAGKTTVFNLITGIYRPDSGRIWLADRELTNLTSDAIVRSGVSRTFQNIRLFGAMTVWDNIRTAFHHRAGYGLWDAIRRSPRYREREREIGRESLDFLDRFGLADRRHELARNLSYGDQRRLEIARALAGGPRVLLLDEPAAGMNPMEVEGLIDLIRGIHRDFGPAILLIEHQMPVVMELCRHIHVMDFGKKIAAGGPREVINDPLVISAYLGDEEAAA